MTNQNTLPSMFLTQVAAHGNREALLERRGDAWASTSWNEWNERSRAIAAALIDDGVVVKHTEDEIAAMNMVVGGAFAGTRSMCATSGGGFSLMVEAFGFAGVSESACVVGLFTPGPNKRTSGGSNPKSRKRLIA